jgi:preprotein translocase subunit SecD
VNKYKAWQIIAIYSVLVFGIIFALPNFYPTKPAIQIAFGDSARVLNTNIVADITRELDEKNIPFVEIEQ